MRKSENREKGFVLMMAILFMTVLFGVMSAIVIRQSYQWVEAEYTGKRNLLQQCSDLAYEIVSGVISPFSYTPQINVVLPGMRVFTGRGSTPQSIQVLDSSYVGSGNTGGGGVIAAGIGGAAIERSALQSGGGLGVLLAPVFTCVLTQGSGNGGFTEVEMVIGYEFGM